MARAIWMTHEPTPPVPPWTNKESPIFSPPSRNVPKWAVMLTKAKAAASTSLTFSGVGYSQHSSTAAYSAKVP